MAEALQPTESRWIPWVTGLIVASLVLALVTILMSLGDGMVRKALPVGIASLALALVAVVMSRTLDVRRGGAMAALVMGVLALCSGLQSAFLGTR